MTGADSIPATSPARDLRRSTSEPGAASRKADHRFVRRVARSLSWAVSGVASWRLFSALSTLLVARILGPAGFGQLGIVLSTSRVFTAIGGLRLGVTSSKYVAQYRKASPSIASRILIVTLRLSLATCLITSLLTALVAPLIANSQPDFGSLLIPLLMGSVALFFFLYTNIQMQSIEGFEDFRSVAAIQLVRGVVLCVTSVALALSIGLTGVLIGHVVASAISMFACHVVLRRHRQRMEGAAEASIDTESAKEARRVAWTAMRDFALPGVLSGLLVAGVIWFSRYLVAAGETGFAELGIFLGADQWRLLVLFLPTALSRAILPALSDVHANERDSFGPRATWNLRATVWIGAAGAIIVSAGCPFIVILLGTDYAASVGLVPLLSLSFLLQAVAMGQRQLFSSAGRRWLNFVLQVPWALLFLGLVMGLNSEGAWGLAIAHVASDLLVVLIQAVALERGIARGASIRSTGPLVASLAALGLLLVTLQTMPVAVHLFVGAGCIAVFMALLWRYRSAVRKLPPDDSTEHGRP